MEKCMRECMRDKEYPQTGDTFECERVLFKVFQLYHDSRYKMICEVIWDTEDTGKGLTYV